MNWYLKVLKDYAVFTGRARRQEYWMFTLFHIIALIVATVLDSMLGLSFKVGDESLMYGYIYLLYNLAVLIPGLAVLVRRLHDIGKTGWYALIALIPIIGAIWLIVLLCRDSDPGDNNYGSNPKGEIHSDEVNQQLT
ncbi:MAG TPA: DUF805 domain-containing protein [Pedobacter sp.]|jgi:uncharacterized membrane protein YhaH (DUF805 family)